MEQAGTHGAASRGDTGYWSWFEHSPIRARWPFPFWIRPTDEKCLLSGSIQGETLGIETTGGRRVCVVALHVYVARLEDSLPRLDLEIVRVIDTPEATHIRYRARR